MNQDPTIYISLDIETDGPIPGPYSMLSLGAVKFSSAGDLLSRYQVNLMPLPGAQTHPETMRWWATKPKAWLAATRDPVPAAVAMGGFTTWVGEKAIAVCYPATFDFMFVYWYLIRFTKKSPFGFQALDLKTYASAILHIPFRHMVKGRMPKAWFADGPAHTHKAVEDAEEQGRLFFKMLDHYDKMLSHI